MGEEHDGPGAEPAGPEPAGAAPSRRRLWLGLLTGVLFYLALMVVELVGTPPGQSDGYRGLAYLLFALIGTPILVLVGALLTIRPAPRQFGIGLLIGSAGGLIVFGGVCVALVTAAV
jgi:hypothetical protein